MTAGPTSEGAPEFTEGTPEFTDAADRPVEKPVPMSRQSFPAAIGWADAVADFLLQTRATREESTERFYRDRLRMLTPWAEAQGVPLGEFRARHLRAYLAQRADSGVSDRTRRHDASVARAFLKFCKREEYIDGDPLAGFQVPKAEQAYVKCPSDDEIRRLLQAIQERWRPAANPAARFVHPTARLFFARRNYAVHAVGPPPPGRGVPAAATGGDNGHRRREWPSTAWASTAWQVRTFPPNTARRSRSRRGRGSNQRPAD